MEVNFKPRTYQESIYKEALKQNTMVVLPTGLGKTNIFLLIAAHHYRKNPDVKSKIILLGPTRPLIEQYKLVFEKFTDIDPELISIFTGRISPEKRQALWKKSKIIFSTPQGMENDVMSNKILLDDVSLIGFDEAHRATGNYAYVWLAQKYQKASNNPHIVAMTASPGTNAETIREVCQNLQIEGIQVRTDQDADVAQYIKEVEIKNIYINLPEELKNIKRFLDNCYTSKLASIKKLGYLTKALSQITKTDLLKINRALLAKASSGEKSQEIYTSISKIAEAMKVSHAIELIQTQGLKPLYEYLNNIVEQAYKTKTKAIKNLVKDPDFGYAYLKAKQAVKNGLEHPKYKELLKLLKAKLANNIEEKSNKENLININTINTNQKENNNIKKIINNLEINNKLNTTNTNNKESNNKNINTSNKIATSNSNKSQTNQKFIIFTQYRDTVNEIVKHLNLNGISAQMFVGQTKKNGVGISQKEQKEIIQNFKDNKFTCLVSSSVGEEGLDIPSVDAVIFFEPIPSVIRKIQRKGRTGRQDKGEVFLLITKNTLDEAYHYISKRKEKTMYESIQKVKKEFDKIDEIKNYKQSKLELKSQEKKQESQFKNIKVIADFREKGSPVLKEIIELDAFLQLEKFEIGDFILSDDVAVEFKNQEDFVTSIVDGRIFQQLRSLKKYKKPIIIIQGTKDLYAIRNIPANAIRAVLSTITIDYNIPIIQTKDAKDTASILCIIAKREQDKQKKEFTFHSAKPMTIKEQQEYVISAIPGIGASLAKPLLEHFKTIKNIVNAKEEELQTVDLIGKTKAKKIQDIVNKEY
jgi:Fanconi anemia group M protein